jgi:excisionase family DNA binding protein
MNRYYTTHEAAELLGVSLPTVVNWIKARRLRCHRTPGGHRRIAREDLAAFMLRHGFPVSSELAGAVPERRKALVLGDLGPAREGAVRQLSEAGWAAEAASLGFAAGAALARFQPHLVVLLAPAADGGETLRALRADRECGLTPVVAVGHADWSASLKAAGATVALARPIGADGLSAAAEAAVAPAPRAPAAVLPEGPAPGSAAEVDAEADARPAARRKARKRVD